MSWLLIPFCDLGNGRNKESVEHIRSAVQDITEEMGFFSPKSFNFEEKKKPECDFSESVYISENIGNVDKQSWVFSL